MKDRRAVTLEIIRRYRRADRRAKTKTLHEFNQTTELGRKYVQLLRGTLGLRHDMLPQVSLEDGRDTAGSGLFMRHGNPGWSGLLIKTAFPDIRDQTV